MPALATAQARQRKVADEAVKWRYAQKRAHNMTYRGHWYNLKALNAPNFQACARTRTYMLTQPLYATPRASKTWPR